MPVHMMWPHRTIDCMTYLLAVGPLRRRHVTSTISGCMLWRCRITCTWRICSCRIRCSWRPRDSDDPFLEYIDCIDCSGDSGQVCTSYNADTCGHHRCLFFQSVSIGNDLCSCLVDWLSCPWVDSSDHFQTVLHMADSLIHSLLRCAIWAFQTCLTGLWIVDPSYRKVAPNHRPPSFITKELVESFKNCSKTSIFIFVLHVDLACPSCYYLVSTPVKFW